MAEPLLQVKNLKVNFLVGKEKVNAVRDINFTVEKGQTLAIVGESGCGKSVTATAIMRLLPKTTSEIDPDTMESKLVKGLYFAGEILDVDGICGGYNLQWAWTSGYLAGKGAANA